jgi:hypothetical protein
MRWSIAILMIAVLPVSAQANNWEKFYQPFSGVTTPIVSEHPPEFIPSTGDLDSDFEGMWKQGFGAIGYTSFESENDKTSDAERLAKKLKARFFITSVKIVSSSTTSIPFSMPTNTTSVTNGNVSVSGNGVRNSGTYNQTTTTYGTSTTYIPITSNRFSKMAVYFQEMPKLGSGIYPRDLTESEIRLYETRRAFAVRFVRDGSPAYMSDVLNGDIVLKVNGLPADATNWAAALRGNQPMKIQLIRNGKEKELEMNIPSEWKPS